MKKRLYATISLKQFAIILCAVVLSASTVFFLEASYLKTEQVSLSKNEDVVIIVDAGHGGEDGGTVSSSGIVEKDINLSISLKLKNLFDLNGFRTIMTRSDDSLIYDKGLTAIRDKKVSDIHNRMAILQSYPNSIFISIHQNHFEVSKYNGAQVFYSKNNPQSEVVAQYIQDSIVNHLQKDNNRQIKPSGTEIYLLYNAVSPAVMVECGFLSNPGEAQKLNDDNYQTKMALAIFEGTVNYLKDRK